MTKRLLVAILLICACIPSIAQEIEGTSWWNTEYNTTEGREFWVTFMCNSGSKESDVQDLNLYLYATSRKKTRVTITNPRNSSKTYTLDLNANEQKSILIDNEMGYIEEPNVVKDRGLRVTSTEPISLYITNHHKSGKYDATNVLPTTALSGEYIVQTYLVDQYATEFCVVSPSSQYVYLHIKETTIDQDAYNSKNIVKVLKTTEKDTTIYMSKGQAYLYRSSTLTTSLSGSWVCADRNPVAMFVGGQSAKIPYVDPENHIFTQAYPCHLWGQHFIVTPTQNAVYDYVRITAKENGTKVYRDNKFIKTINQGETFQDTIISESIYEDAAAFVTNTFKYTPTVAYYSTSKPTECFLYGTGYSVNGPSLLGSSISTNADGAPVLTPIIPQELGMKSNIFATFTNSKSTLSHYVNIVTPTSETAGMRLDGANISGDFKVVPSNPTYSYAVKKVSAAAHKIENVTNRPTSTFTARVYGLGKSSAARESYAYAPGSRAVRGIDILINDQYIKEKTICFNQSLKFTSIINADYDSKYWDFGDGTRSYDSIVPAKKWSSAGDYVVSLILTKKSFLCDNVTYRDSAKVLIHVKEEYNFNYKATICRGDTAKLVGLDENGQRVTKYYTKNTTETVRFKTVAGCDSVVHVQVVVGDPDPKTYVVTACNSYYWDVSKNRYTTSGIYLYTRQNTYNCETTDTLKLTVNYDVVGAVKDTIVCKSNVPFVWNGKTVNKAGKYSAHLTSAHGCDSLATINVIIESLYREEKTIHICPGETYSWRGKVLSEPNLYTEFSPSPAGCDSTFILHLKNYPTYNKTATKELCEGETYQFGDTILKTAGTYTKKLKSVYGCDSIVTLTIIVHPAETEDIYETTCSNKPYLFDGKKLDQTGTYTKISQTAFGCGKTTILHLTVYPVSVKWDTVQICERNLPYTYAPNKQATRAGDYSVTFEGANMYGCDSTYNLHLVVQKTIVTNLPKVYQCDYDGAYSHPNPDATNLHNLTKSGTYKDTLVSVSGCDSVLVLPFVMGKRTYATLTARVCEEDLPWIDPYTHRQLRRDTTYNDTIENSLRCDSVVSVHFSVKKAYVTTIDTTICESESPYNHPDKSMFQGLTTSGQYKKKVSSMEDCDSTIILNLTINPTTYKYMNVLECENNLPYVYGEHHKKAYVTGIYRDTMITPNRFGCDSILVLNLSILNTIVDVQNAAICDNELPYNHPDNRATRLQHLMTTGIYKDTLKSISGCDSVIELHLQVWSTYEVSDAASICDNESYNYRGHVFDHVQASLSPYRLDTMLHSIYGCDSLVHFALNVYPTYLFETTKLMGSNEKYEWRGNIIDGAKYQGLTEPVVFWDSIAGGTKGHHCDSVYKLTLQVAPSYHFYDTVQMCSDGEYHWQHLPAIDTTFYGLDILPNGVRVGTHIYRDTLKTIMDCDSIFELRLTVDSAYLKVGKHDTTRVDICANETYPFKSLSKDTTINNNGDLANADKSINIYFIEGMDKTIHGCDSAVCHKVFIHPIYDFTQKTYICQDTVNTQWEWIDDQGGSHGKYPRDKVGVFHLGDHQYTKQGCDSIFGVELHVMPIYRFDTTLYICENDSVSWQDVLFVGSQFAAYGKTYDASRYDSVRTNMSAGEYSSVVRHYTATYDCDSTYLAKIVVSKVYRTTIERRACQTETGYYYEHLNRGTGGLLPARYLSDSLTRNDTVPSVTGCDSIITLHYYVDSVYDYRQKVAVCQDTVNTQWEWIDEDGISHGFISIADSGNYSYEQKYKTIHGCDSIYGIQIRVKPIYRFDSIYHICENERISWQNKWYAGDSLSPMAGDSVLKPGQYYDTAHYFTRELCDSTYYLVLNVYPIYDTLTKANACANEGFTWHQTDAFGAYADEVCPASSYHTHWLTCEEAAADLPRPIYDTTMMQYDRMLKTIHGCDSMSHLELVVHPAYLFITDTTICGNVVIKYRGKFFRGQDTTYNDRWQTTAGCDSIYQLRLHVRPVFISHENRTLCDNETLYHESKNGMDVIWKPEYTIPDPEFEPTDMVYTDLNGCDSIYRYFLTIHPSFFHADSDTICTNINYMFHDARDISPMHEYSMSEYILPFDTIIKDSLSTVHGCDSVYWLYAHIRPAYRDVLLDTICDTETYQWRSHTIAQGNDLYQFTAAGDYTYWDSLVTTEGCDSIYELRLCVHPSYFTRYDESICADEVYAFNGRELNASGFYYDSLTTVSGCDSVYHLYLTVLDTTYEIRFDTVCYGDTVFLSHDTVLQSGFYKDTTPNEWGCHHFLYLYLTYIEPSVPHIVADSMCLDHDAFEIEFAYTGTKPVAYSLYFDDFGHDQGFEDMVDYPIEPQFWDDEERYSLVVRTPWRDGDSTKYPRPDHYPIRLVLDNGYCRHLTKYLDTTIVMNYPSWVTQQRFRDVIAIYSSKYNGGYEFSKFQWYRNNEPMPGETHEYLYLPQELEVDTTWYHVRLTRVGETESFQTCPINIFYDPIDTIAPIYSYLSVVPTCVDASHPVVNILCHYSGIYWVHDEQGKFWKSDYFYPGAHDAFEVDLSELPANNIYIFTLMSERTEKEPSRSIRVLIDGGDCACHPK